MKKISLIISVLSLISIRLSTQVGINTSTPNAKSVLDITSTTKGLLPPRMTEAQRDAISDPIPAGLQVWCTNCGPNGEMQVYDGLAWTNLAGVAATTGPFICGTTKVTFKYSGQKVTYGTVISGERCWLDRNLGATQVATSSTDVAAYGDLFQWGRGADKHQRRNPVSLTTTTLSSGDTPGHGKFILNNGANYDWRSPHNDNLWQGITGANNPCPTGFRLPTDVEWDTEIMGWSSNDQSGAFTSVLKLPSAGYRLIDNGSINVVAQAGLYWSSTVSSVYSQGLDFNIGGASVGSKYRGNGLSVRCIKDTNYPGSIGSLDCSGAEIDGTLTDGVGASGVSADISYTNGNGASHVGQTVLSSGVTGLTATLTAGNFASGAGSLTYTITGTPESEGTADFALNIGGQSCTLSIQVASASFTCGVSTVTFTYNGSSVTYGTVVGAGNRCWLDRNLGASQVATSSIDAAAYGDLFQWGRGDDSHQVRNPLSGTTTTLSNMDNPGHGNFILAQNIPYDWRSPQNTNLWQGVSALNNPCPSGYRLPTSTELDIERVSWGGNQNASGAFNSPLKLPVAGGRSPFDGSLNHVGSLGIYWSGSPDGGSSRILLFYSSFAGSYLTIRADGLSVRCIKD